MKQIGWLVLILALGLPSAVQGQSIYYGKYVRAAASEDFTNLEFGFWVPYTEGFEITARGAGTSCDTCAAFRTGISAAQENETEQLEGRLHLEIGLGWERAFLLLGPYYSFGEASRANWGGRLGGGVHLSDWFSLEASGDFSGERKPRYSLALVFTF